ncbi:MAG TPA: DUF2459 domain-containing protein [Nevskia sp.]|nr:DUF2459 domain-containing protein [Nevskia sp.]
MRTEALRRLGCALLLAGLSACSAIPVETGAAAATHAPPPPASAYVLRRGRHTDLVLPVAGLDERLSTLTADFAAPRYLVFGFGDRQYMLATHRNAWHALLAPLPGAGVVLVTGLQETPQQAYGAEHLAPLRLSAAQLRELQRFVWDSLEQDPPGAVRPYLPGQLPENVYYASTRTYWGFYTCNTWTAEALQKAGLPVRSGGVLFAGQVWDQIRPTGNAPAEHTR